MSTPAAPAERRRLPLRRRLVPLCAVAAARVLAELPPVRLRAVLERLRRGAAPATYARAGAARRAVVSVSLRCSGQACLQRSIAVALLCRVHGTWPTWCTGDRTSPFAAHVWVEAERRPVGEPFPKGHYVPLLTIPPSPTPSGRSALAPCTGRVTAAVKQVGGGRRGLGRVFSGSGARWRATHGPAAARGGGRPRHAPGTGRRADRRLHGERQRRAEVTRH